MKRLFLSVYIIIAAASMLCAQNCATGYCPSSLIVHHKAGQVSPVTVDITYGVDQNAYSGTTACWITRNLGATTQATAYNDATAASAGWYWQFGQMQGYSFSTGSRVPSTTWPGFTQSTNWASSADPCTLLLGSTWRIPTSTEWSSVISSAGWSSSYAAAVYSSNNLKLHMGGYVSNTGTIGSFDRALIASSTVNSSTLSNIFFEMAASNYAQVSNVGQTAATSIRCLRTY